MCVNLIWYYTIKSKDDTLLGLMCSTMINPVTSWCAIVELSTTEVQVAGKVKEIVEMIIDTSSACIARLFEKVWFQLLST